MKGSGGACRVAMAIHSTDAAKFVCRRGSWHVTNLALQKILYLAHMVHMGRTRSRLIGAHFEAWDFGPVEPYLYRKVRAFGAKPIPNIFYNSRELDGTPEGDTLAEACENLLSKSPGELVSNTHWEHGAWARNYVPGARGVIIPDGHIIEEYDRRMAG